MTKLFKKLAMGIALTFAALTGQPGEARAYENDYCREYTRTVYIGGRTQEAYGRACLQPNGDWMIVGEGLGNDIPDNVNDVRYVINDNRRQVVPTRVVYYSQPQVRYYETRRAQPAFVWYHNGHYKNGHYVSYKRDRNWDRHDRGRRDSNWSDWNGRNGRGHDHRDRDRR